MQTPSFILPPKWRNAKTYCLDLSVESSEFADIDPTDSEALIVRTNKLLKKNNAELAIGRYNEVRAIYNKHTQFKDRCLHLGIDLTLPPGTEIFAPLDATVHSFADNAQHGDYGPTIILKHAVDNTTFHTLYGHLSKDSLMNLKKAARVKQGACIGRIGTSNENGGWPPHLHFQIVNDMGDYEGDYPGLCSLAEKDYYLNNCPDPNKILQLNY